jgi:hypothetical protein
VQLKKEHSQTIHVAPWASLEIAWNLNLLLSDDTVYFLF